ncbi:phage holin family protein [Nocardioides sp.]|uniref:phage holin family protein n=1 Tax=Nocardioides sp. TaxID=35761 RepID=UPI0035122C2C
MSTQHDPSVPPPPAPSPAHAGPAGTDETADGRSLGDLVGDIAHDLSTLVRQEVDLAKTEARSEIARAGRGAGLFGGAGIAGHLALIFVSLAAVLGLGHWLDAAWAALIVGAAWAIAAAGLALTGRKAFARLTPALPTTQQTLKEDARWAQHMKNG